MTEDYSEWNRIFEVLEPPPRGSIQFLRPGHQIQVGDFAWASPRCPKDLEGTVHLTGYDEKMLNIWYADLALSKVRYIGPKPASWHSRKNPYPVKSPRPSAELYLGRIKCFFLRRLSWWKTRHIRLKYGKS